MDWGLFERFTNEWIIPPFIPFTTIPTTHRNRCSLSFSIKLNSSTNYLIKNLLESNNVPTTISTYAKLIPWRNTFIFQFPVVHFHYHHNSNFPYSHSDDLLSITEFTLICRALFRNDKGHIYVVPQERLEQMFSVFDKNGDGFIDREEFQFCWNHWIKTVSVLKLKYLGKWKWNKNFFSKDCSSDKRIFGGGCSKWFH